MPGARLEILVEPFKENRPGPHVNAVVAAAERAGLDPDMGPFATTAHGDLDTVIAVAADLLRSGFDAGATTIQLRVELSDGP